MSMSNEHLISVLYPVVVRFIGYCSVVCQGVFGMWTSVRSCYEFIVPQKVKNCKNTVLLYDNEPVF